MFEKAQSDNKMMTWILRAAGVIVMTTPSPQMEGQLSAKIFAAFVSATGYSCAGAR